MIETVIYKNIPGYEGLYQATSEGYIYALPRTWVAYRGGVHNFKGGIVSTSVSRDGYILVKLTNDKGVRKTTTVHRLVALTFIENTLNKPSVNHINGVKSDNRPENLEWVTHKENIAHSFKIGLGNTKVACDSQRIKVTDKETNEVFISITEAAKSLGMSRRHLSMMLKGERPNKTNIVYYETNIK